MIRALFPGTFDPPTLAHVDVIRRAAKMFHPLYVGVAENSAKKTLFSAQDRVSMLREVTADLTNVEVLIVDGLVADFAKNKGVDCLVRGLRSFSDCEHEFRMALANRRMSGLETFFLVSSEHLAHLSSTLIREIAASGQHLEAFVPKPLIARVYAAVESQQS